MKNSSKNDEKVIYRSRLSPIGYLRYCWIYAVPVFYLVVLVAAEFKIDDGIFVIIAVVLHLFMCLELSFGTCRFIITDKHLKITRTLFFREVYCYPLEGIQGHALAEKFSFSIVKLYSFKVKLNDKVDEYIFPELSKGAMKKMEQIPFCKENTMPDDAIKHYYDVSIYTIVNLICTCFAIYFIAAYLVIFIKRFSV